MWKYRYPITSDEFYHHGIKGMKWGRRLYQNKDGSLTALGRKRYGMKDSKDDKAEESIEQRRARILKSTDPKELYKNRDVLTTNEIKERLDRIDTERRLASIAESTKKTGFDRVDKALKIGRKINEVYEFTNTPVMKALKKKLGFETEPSRLSLREVYDKRNSLSDKTLSDALRRAKYEKEIKELLDDMDKIKNDAKTNADKQKDSKTKEKPKDSKPKDDNTKTNESKKSDSSKNTKEKTKDEKVYTGEVFGKGTSRYKETDNSPIIDIDFEDLDYRSPTSTEYARIGEKRVKRLLLK